MYALFDTSSWQRIKSVCKLLMRIDAVDIIDVHTFIAEMDCKRKSWEEWISILGSTSNMLAQKYV